MILRSRLDHLRFYTGIPTLLRIATLAALVLLETANAARAEPPASSGPRKYLLERVDDAAIAQVYADGFNELPIEQKRLTWRLYQAAVVGRDIYYDQRCAEGLAMRQVLETVVAHPDGIDPTILAEIRRYSKLFWINCGPYNNLTARKFVLKCTPDQLSAAVKKAISNAGRDSEIDMAHAEARLAELGRMFFDAEYKPIVTNKTPGQGKDILAESANNLYQNVTMADLRGFHERYGLNSRLVKTPDGLSEQVYRTGGLYGSILTPLSRLLVKAEQHASRPTAEALRALRKFYMTGEDADRRAYDIAWVRDRDAQVDTINGFIEVYMDARGVKGSWEAAVFFVNKQKTGAIKALAGQAPWFEAHMPWDPKYRKDDVRGITANAIDVVIETGDCGPVTPIGINLPNDQSVREQFGSKSVSLSNVLEASDRSTPTSFRREFAWDDAEAARAEKWSTLGQELLVNMHEVIGHASGRTSEAVKGKPQDALKEYYSALEEGRADLVALYYMPDPKLAELGLVGRADQAEMARAAYESYARNALVQLRRVREGSQLEEDHMRNRQMVVHWLMANTRAIERRSRDDRTYYVVTDVDGFRAGVGKLLSEVQAIKSEGNYSAAKVLFDTHGIRFDPKLRDEVVARVSRLDLPSYTGYVFPRLTPVKAADGTITDVTLSYPADLTTQMLELSRQSRDLIRGLED
ncbi:MAG: peptidase M49 [Isosphaeraceae bacterium]